jgi:predicted ArsR family transcriptional regulator
MAALNLLGPTKRQMLALLRRAPRTVHELAGVLGLTDTAVRTHLVSLERDGLVEPSGRRLGVRKPAILYSLAPSADQLFAKPYAAVANLILGGVKERHSDEELSGLLGEAGHRLAHEHRATVSHLTGRARVEAIADVLNSLGGLAQVQEQDEGFRIEGSGCPLSAVVACYPEACKIAEEMIQTLVGEGTVTAQCEHTGEPHCSFAIKRVP